MKVPSFTTEYGYKTRQSHMYVKRTLRYSWATWDYTADWSGFLTTGHSLRYEPVKGSPPYPTNYTRKIGICTSLNSVDLKYQWRQESADSRAFIGMSGVPHGSPWANPLIALPSWMEDQVKQKAYLKLLEIKANILEDLGQARQTVNMLASILSFIMSTYVDMRRGNYGSAFKRIGAAIPSRPTSAADAWLTYYYGIKPLVGTMDALVGSYSPRVLTKTASSKEENSVDPLGFCDNGAAYVLSGEAKQHCRCVYTVKVNVDSDLRRGIALGFSGNFANDAVVTAWALYPYSFVVDWILPVEQWLRTRSWSSSLQFISGFLQRKLTCDAAFRQTDWISYSGEGDSRNAKGTFPSVQIKALQFQREALNTPPPSGLSFRVSLTPEKLISAAALITQRS